MPSIRLLLAGALALSVLSACGDVAEGPVIDPDEDGAHDAFLADGYVVDTDIHDRTREAKGVRRLLAASTQTLLAAKTDVGLGPKGALALWQARAGADGTTDTEDDGHFDTLQALDDVPFIGPKAFTKLLDYARANGFVPPDPCGEGQPQEGGPPMPEDVRTKVSDLELRVGTDRLQVFVRGRSPLTAEQIEEFRARSCEAITFDLDELQIDSDVPQLALPLRVVILDTIAYNNVTGAAGTYGVTFMPWENDGDAFVVPENALKEPEDLDDTLAHELMHMLQGRFAPNDAYIPWYFIEGQAIDIGSLFAFRKYGRSNGFAKGWVRQADGDDAKLTFERYGLEDKTKDLREVGHDQALSGFFLEYLRVLHPREGEQKGWPDALRRTFLGLQDVSEGTRLAAAFSARMDGLTLADAKAAFIAWLDATKSQGNARLAGTVWE